MKKPNVPMNHAITTCRHKVDKKKFEDGWERIWGSKKGKQGVTVEFEWESTKHQKKSSYE